MKPARIANQCRGFTLIELAVVIAVVGILSVMLVPVLCQSKTTSRGMDCLNNQKQLALAAKMYADDNRDNWVPNFPGQTPGWVAGNMDWNSGNTDNTNSDLLINPIYSVMGSYSRNPGIYHCPADNSFALGKNRVRSVSMNQAVGTVWTATGQLKAGDPVNGQWLSGNNLGSSIQNVWRTYGKTSSMVIPVPSQLWIFIDEHPDSINDGGFAVQMQYTGVFARIIDFPASFHNGAAGISFADGHAEIHKWIGNTIKPPVIPGGGSIGYGVNNAGDSAVDITWLQARTSAAR